MVLFPWPCYITWLRMMRAVSDADFSVVVTSSKKKPWWKTVVRQQKCYSRVPVDLHGGETSPFEVTPAKFNSSPLKALMGKEDDPFLLGFGNKLQGRTVKLQGDMFTKSLPSERSYLETLVVINQPKVAGWLPSLKLTVCN